MKISFPTVATAPPPPAPDVLKNVPNPMNTKQIRKVSEDFEAIFLNMVFKSMRETVPKEGLLDGGNAEEIYRSMLDGEYADQMAHQRQTGLANAIERFILDSLPKDSQGAQGLQPGPKQVTIDRMESHSRASVGVPSGHKTR